MSDEMLLALQNGQYGVSSVADPSGTPGQLAGSQALRNFRQDCLAGNDQACLSARQIEASITRLQLGSAANPRCRASAVAIMRYYESGAPPPLIARNYDHDCMGALAARSADASEPARRPPVLKDAERAGGVLSNIGIVIDGDQPNCSGLLLPDYRFVTARHCMGLVKSIGRVHQASTGRQFALAGNPRAGPVANRAEHDWAIFDIAADPGYSVGPIEFDTPQGTFPTTVVAGWRYGEIYDPQVAPLASLVRFPRPGLCDAVHTTDGRIEMVCQTMRTMSGAPVFQAESLSTLPVVVGFLSAGKASNDSAGLGVSNTTLAVRYCRIRGLIGGNDKGNCND